MGPDIKVVGVREAIAKNKKPHLHGQPHLPLESTSLIHGRKA